MHVQSMLQRFGSEGVVKLIRKKISKSFYRANIFLLDKLFRFYLHLKPVNVLKPNDKSSVGVFFNLNLFSLNYI